MSDTRTKPGPKPKVGEPERQQVIAIIKAGGSLSDAADIIGVTRKTVQNAMRADPKFYAGVKKAKKSGKMRLVKKVSSAKAWQAAAWMLERKYGREFGRKETREITGKGGGAIQTSHTTHHVIDYDQIRRDLEEAVRSNGTAHRRIPANGDGEPVHPRNAN